MQLVSTGTHLAHRSRLARTHSQATSYIDLRRESVELMEMQGCHQRAAWNQYGTQKPPNGGKIHPKAKWEGLEEVGEWQNPTEPVRDRPQPSTGWRLFVCVQ